MQDLEKHWDHICALLRIVENIDADLRQFMDAVLTNSDRIDKLEGRSGRNSKIPTPNPSAASSDESQGASDTSANTPKSPGSTPATTPSTKNTTPSNPDLRPGSTGIDENYSQPSSPLLSSSSVDWNALYKDPTSWPWELYRSEDDLDLPGATTGETAPGPSQVIEEMVQRTVQDKSVHNNARLQWLEETVASLVNDHKLLARQVEHLQKEVDACKALNGTRIGEGV